MPKAWFRVATEGATTDDRNISRAWLEQIAKNYDPSRFGARIWLEHMRGILPDGPFKALGDITAVRTEENSDGKLELHAEFDPTDDLQSMVQARQKVYSSLEVDPNFADTGEAYLVGMGVTDSPASLGTEMLQFAAQKGASSPLAARKQSPRNVFTAAAEIDLSALEESAAPKPGEDAPSLMERITALFQRHDAKTDKGFADFRADLEQTLGLFVERHQALAADLDARPSAEAFNELKAAHDTLQREFNALRSQLDTTPDTPPRTTATGADGDNETDC